MENITTAHSYKILIADDYPVNRTIYTNLLSFEGYDVVEATNGQEVINLHKQNKFDLIIMDLHMPVMNGAEATQIIRSAEKEADVASPIPIIVLTGDTEMVNKQYYLDIGFSDYLPKPINREGLLNIVRTNLKQPRNLKNARKKPEKLESRDSASKPLDLEKAFYDFDNNRELFLNIVQKFLLLLNSQTKLIRTAIKQEDIKTVRDIAHAIKGSAGNIYAYMLMDAAKELESFAKINDNDKLSDYFKIFQEEKEKLEVFFKKVMNNVQDIYQ